MAAPFSPCIRSVGRKASSRTEYEYNAQYGPDVQLQLADCVLKVHIEVADDTPLGGEAWCFAVETSDDDLCDEQLVPASKEESDDHSEKFLFMPKVLAVEKTGLILEAVEELLEELEQDPFCKQAADTAQQPDSE